MKRIMVVGVSAGVGKSTFAARLGKALDISVYHLDTYFWKPNWVEATYEEFAGAQQKIVKQESAWIIEGNYSNTFDIRVNKADTIIYLELPLYFCLYRVVKRWITNIGKTRPDLGCTERLDWEFIKFIYSTYYPRKKKMQERMKTYGGQKLIVQLKNRSEMEAFLQSVEKTKG